MAYDAAFLKELKQKNDILEVAEGYFDNIIKSNDTTYKTNCPNKEGHSENGDTNASLTFFLDTQTFYCFGCGVGSRDVSGGSDVIALVQWMDGVTWHQAIRKLAQRANMPIPSENPELVKEKNNLLNLNRRYWKQLQDSKEGLEYFHGRGITDEMIAKWRLGYNASTPPKLTFAIIDHYGDTVGFAYRFLRDEDKTPDDPKYVNSKTSHIFNKRRILYGLNYAIPMIRKCGYAVLVEGYFDVMALQHYGVPAAGFMGTSVTDEQVELIKDYTKNVILFFDGDGAGDNATVKTIKILEANGINTKVMIVDGMDPDDIAFSYLENTRQYIEESALKISQYKLNREIDRFNARYGELITTLIRNTSPLLAEVTDPAEKLAYITQLNKLMGMDYTSILLSEDK